MREIINVLIKEIQNELEYKGTPVLYYSIMRPVISSERYNGFARRLNAYYKHQAMRRARFCELIFLRRAEAAFDEAEKGGYSFNELIFTADVRVTCQEDGILSIYSDEGRYTGETEASVFRTADSWNMQKRKRIGLCELYPGAEDCNSEIIAALRKKVSYESCIQEDGENRLSDFFYEKNFFLRPGALAVYFQEGTIAELSSGIVEFKLPYVLGPLKIRAK